MHIVGMELLRLELDLRFPLKTSAGEHRHRPLLIVRIATEGGVGYGECSALEEPTYTEEYADGAEAVLREHLLPRLGRGGTELSVEEAMRRVSVVRGHSMAKAGIEMALLDVELAARGLSLAHYLGATATSIPAGANISLGRADAVCAAVQGVVEEGYTRVKVKIAPGFDVDVLSSVRAAFPDIALSADANGAYDMSSESDMRALRRMDALGLTCLEQPLAPGDLVGSAALCAELSTPVILDESVGSWSDFENAVALVALDGVSIKPARLGGLEVARRVHDRALELGLSCSIGGMLESGLGRAAAIALGALPGFDLPGDLGASDRYFVPDLTSPHELMAGELSVPHGLGIGAAINSEVLRSKTVRVTRVPLS